MQNKIALLIGASGLTGSFLLDLLLKENSYTKVIILVRKSLGKTHAKLEERIVDFSNPESFKNSVTHANVLFCCIGTTMKNVKGNKELYKSIDFDIPVNAARFAASAGVEQFHLISAVSANSKSNLFYNKLKGEVEEAITQFPFKSIHIYKPGLLIGNRKEFRLGEKIAQMIMPLFNFLMMGGLQKYKSIKAIDVAMAMYSTSLTEKEGVDIYTYNEMKKVAILSA